MQTRWPDVVVLDVEMPRMDGITFLRQIMAERPTPVVMCPTLTAAGATTTMQALGLALDSLHQFAAADSALARALELRRKFLPADHWLIPNAEAVYGYHLGRVGRNAEAERILRAAYERMAQLRGADAAPTRRVAVRLAELMEKLGRTDDAKRWRAKG